MRMAGAGSNFFNCFFSTSLILLKLNGCQILKLDVLKVGTFTFAVLMAILNPLEYCLKYGGSLISGEKALQAGNKGQGWNNCLYMSVGSISALHLSRVLN